MSSDGDPDGNVDAVIMLLTAVMTAFIFFIAICGCCTGMVRHKCCITLFALFGLIFMILLFIVGAGFFGLKVLGDELCEMVQNPEK